MSARGASISSASSTFAVSVSHCGRPLSFVDYTKAYPPPFAFAFVVAFASPSAPT